MKSGVTIENYTFRFEIFSEGKIGLLPSSQRHASVQSQLIYIRNQLQIFSTGSPLSNYKESNLCDPIYNYKYCT